jgi:uroporphyrinogen decarboxylase
MSHHDESRHPLLPASIAQYKAVESHELNREHFPALRNDCLLRALRGEPTPFTPVWLMRQAGRYLPEYHRPGPGDGAATDFFTRCDDAALAAQTTLQPLARFAVDAAIIFSDILVVPRALGRAISMHPGHGPCFDLPLTVDEPLPATDPLADPLVLARLEPIMRALTVTRHRLAGHVPLIGFAGGPWTLLAYMIEGTPSKTWSKARAWLYRHPARAHQWLALLARLLVRYLADQVAAGAQALQLFESNAGYLTRELAAEFMLPYMCDIASGVKALLAARRAPAVPLVAFPKDAAYAVAALEASEFDAVSLDWADDATELAALYRLKPRSLAFQGNLDPCALHAPAADLRVHVARMLSSFPAGHGHVANLGHGIYPDADPAAVAVFVDAVHRFDRARELRIGTRGSALALVQARQVWRALTAAHPTRCFRIVTSDALGDRDTDTPIAQLGVKGAFTSELEAALLDNRIDVAVHSLKDLATRLTPATALVAVPAREDVADALVVAPALRLAGVCSLAQLPAGARVGTSSARRTAQLAAAAPHLVAVNVRGNVQTRLRKLADPANNLSALVLACAGLRRLGLGARIDARLDWTHAVAQAALGVQARADDPDVAALLAPLNDTPTLLRVSAERALASRIGLGCSVPAAVAATLADGGELELRAEFYSPDGKRVMRDAEKGAVADVAGAIALGERLAERMLAAGADAFLKN